MPSEATDKITPPRQGPLNEGDVAEPKHEPPAPNPIIPLGR
jgi:hypothetical protein